MNKELSLTGDNELARKLAPLLLNTLVFTEWGWLLREGAVFVEVHDAIAIKMVSDLLVEEGLRLRKLKKKDGTALVPYVEAKKLSSGDKARQVTTLLKAHLREDELNFDSDGYLLNCPNTVIDLRSGETRDHRPEDRFRKVTAVPFDPTVEQDTWFKALESMDPAVRDWMQLRFGGALFGSQGPDALVPFLKGTGKNGKTLVVSTVAGALGNYAVLVSPSMLDSKMGNSAEYYFADLLGARFGYIEELPSIYLNENAVKRLSGSVNITARAIRMAPVTFKSTANLFITTNHTIRLTSNDGGTARRLAEIPFPYKYVSAPVKADERQTDISLAVALESEAGRMQALVWLVQGAARTWHAPRKYMTPPAQVEDASADWKDSADPVKGWADVSIVYDDSALTPWPVLVSSFASYALGNGTKPLGEYALREGLQNLAYGDAIEKADWRTRQRILSGVGTDKTLKWCVRGIRLITDADPIVPAVPSRTSTSSK